MTLLIGDKLVVSMHYTLSDDDKNVLDSSKGEEPMSYLHGAGHIIPGLENALVGKVVGDSLKVKVEPADGYGDFRPNLVQVVDKSAFEGIETIEVGMTFNAHAPDGSPQHVMVKDIDNDAITIDANHPLAGKVLHFDVEIVEVREATKEEAAHGHVH